LKEITLKHKISVWPFSAWNIRRLLHHPSYCIYVFTPALHG